ncbi:MAG: hypothetical protein GY832_23395, partial [Chloroflexi bacterium]|nr:hypothetical protein [Chloroflexota bacterium]
QYLTGTHTWPSWLSDYPLHISERFSINSSGVLVIEAGVRLELVHNMSYPSVDVYGTLRTLGTSDNPVIFTRQGSSGNWSSLIFREGSRGVVEHTIIEYAGAISIKSDDVHISHSTIRYGDYDGISIGNASPKISDSIITDNDQVGIRINRGSSIISGCTIVNNGLYGLDIDYASPIVSDCTIAYNGDNGIDVSDSGSGSGENSSPIISGCSIANNNGVGIDLSGIQLVDGLPVVSGNTISGNTDYAVRVKVDKLSAAFANTNTFSENGEDAVYVLANGQYLTGTHTWPSWLSDYPLHISERFRINSSGVLVIEAGVRLELVHNLSYPSVDVYGTLRTLGTSDNPVIFTRQTGVTNWGYMSFEGMSGGQLDYTIIEYGSGIGIESSDVQIANSIIRYSKYNGISISNASPTISHNDIYDNSGRGISTSGDLSLSIIRYNNIYDNGSYGLYNNAADTTVNARNNWWGDTSGPYHPTSNPDGDGNRVSSYVDFEPWLGQQTQESEDIIETALPEDPVRDTEPAQSDVPHIESIESEHGFFLFGTETYGTELTVNIDWNGSEAGTGTIGIAEFRVGRQTFSQAGDENGVIYDLPISSLKPGINNVEIVAVLNNGTESKVHTVQITRFLASTWLYGLGFNDTFQVTVKPDYVEAMISVKFPPQPFEVNVSSVNGVPFLNNTKKPKKPEIGLDLSLRSDSKGTVKIYGNFPFCFAGAEASFNPSGKGTLYFDEQGRLGVENGLFQAKGKTKIKLPKVSLVRVVAQGIPLDYIADVYLQTTVEPSLFVQKGFKYAPSASTIEWQPGGQLGGDLKLTLELVGEVLKGLIQVTGYGGGSAGVTFQVPPNPEYLYQVRGSAFLGLKFKALGLIKGDPWETKWEYSYKPGDTLQSPVNITTLTNIDTTSIRVVEWDEEDWHVEQRDYGKQPYARFVGGIAPLMVRNRQVNSLRATTTPLVTNLYAQANPDLALREDQALLLWAHDDVSLPESQSKEILSSWWNGATWSTPISVTDNTMSEFNPQVALVNGNQTLAVWERIDDPAVPMTATLDVTLTNKVELAYAVFDFDSQTWNTPALLTDNQVFDHVPQLAANGDGQVMAVWRSNVDGELLGSPEHPDALNYAIWDGSAWSITGTITDSIGDLLVYSVAYSDTTHATVVLNRDQDGDQTTHEDIELFATEWNGAGWNTPTQLTDNSVADENPTVLYTTSGERRLIWMQGTRLAVWHDDWSVAPTLTDVEDGDLGMMNFAVALDDEDNLMLIWRDYSDAGQDLFHALYNAESATWSLEAQLTDNEALEKDFTAAFDPNGQLMVAYAQDNLVETNMVISPTLTISDVTTYDSTDLYILHYIPNTDLTITDLSLPEYWDNPWPGDTVNVYATVRNSGDWAVVSPTIALYDGNPTISGTLIATATVTVGPLAGGVSEQVSIQWTVPLTPVQPHTLYAVIDPSDVITETDEVNNVISLTTTLPDVAVSSVKAYYYDQHNIVPLAMVANNGPITATDILVEFREGTVTGTVRHSHTITQLAPYGLTAVTTTWNVSTWGEGDYTYYVVLDSGDTIIEVNETDNWDYFPIKVLPDLVIYSGDVQASLDPVTGGPVTVTVRNWGIADAANVQVALYEGPVITTAATALYTWTVPSLPVDGDVILNTTIDHRPNRLFAIADPSRVITEVEEYNNVALTVQPISVTLRYHNLESVIPSTATVTLNGNWTTNTITLTNLADVYSVTLHIADTPLRYRYAVDGDIYLLNTFTRTVTPTVSTVYDDYRNVFAGWAQLDGPTALTTTVGTPTAPITAQVYISDVTPLAGSGATIHAEIGYGTSITLTEWIWSPSAYTADMGDNDQFAGVITPTLSGTYSYTVRFDGNWGASNPNSAWLYADLDGTDNGFSLGSAGMLTVP